MTSKLIPSNPEKVMVLRKVTPDILTASVPFLRFGRVQIGGRGTVVRLQNGSLAVFSPVALTDELKRTVNEMGQVKYITALDAEHHIFLDAWHAAYPQASVIGPSNLPEKRKQQNKPLDFHHLFSKRQGTGEGEEMTGIDKDFEQEFEYEYIPAHPNKEIVFHHKPSRTLIEADFLFNLPATEQMSKTGLSAQSGWITKLFCNINTTSGPAIWQKRFLWYLMSSSDRPSYNKSVARIDGWDFDRLIPCHGDVIETGAKGVYRKMFEWHLAAAKKGQ